MRVGDNYMLQAEPETDPATARVVLDYPTPRTSRLQTPKPMAIIWHYTGGLCNPGYAENLAKAITKMEGRPASWNALVAKNGTIYQAAAMNQGTWHVGLPGVISGQSYPNVNRATVGIELENAGQLKLIDGGYYVWPYYKQNAEGVADRGAGPDPKLQIGESRVVTTSSGGVGTFFDDFPVPQLLSAQAMLAALVRRFGWNREASSYGHVDFKPKSGKIDPGPVFTLRYLPKILDEVFK